MPQIRLPNEAEEDLQENKVKTGNKEVRKVRPEVKEAKRIQR